LALFTQWPFLDRAEPALLRHLLCLPRFRHFALRIAIFFISPGHSRCCSAPELAGDRGFPYPTSEAPSRLHLGVLPELEHLLRVALLLHDRARPAKAAALLAVALGFGAKSTATLHALVPALASAERRPHELPAGGVTAPLDGPTNAAVPGALGRLVSARREAVRPIERGALRPIAPRLQTAPDAGLPRTDSASHRFLATPSCHFRFSLQCWRRLRRQMFLF
jgi:hypothetical protein